MGIHTSQISFDEAFGDDDSVIFRDSITGKDCLNEFPRIGSVNMVHIPLFSRHLGGSGEWVGRLR
jgi:hypothetical protein